MYHNCMIQVGACMTQLDDSSVQFECMTHVDAYYFMIEKESHDFNA